MASLSTDRAGNRLIQFTRPGRPRATVRLGKLSNAKAKDAKKHVQELVLAQRFQHSLPPATSAWLAAIDDDFHAKLAAVDLVSPREAKEPESTATLGEFLDAFVARRSDVKPATRIVYGHTKRCLVEFFGAGKPLTEITPAEADDWRRWLATHEFPPQEGRKGGVLSDNTIRRRCGIARQFFRDAVRRRLIIENPFAEIGAVSVQANRSRDYFLSREDATKIINACPDAQWKLLFALSRYGGLRCPSEHLALNWGDVDFEAGRITVRASKTEHHEGDGIRIMPLFPELRPYLQAVLDELLEDFDPKAQRLSEQPVITRYRDANANLRTQLCRILKRAGVAPWPKLFQNLRATRATELAREFPAHVAAAWMGHSREIADKHYWRVTDDDFAAALGSAAESAAAPSRNASHSSTAENVRSQNTSDIPGDAAKCDIVQIRIVGDTRLELVTSTV